MSWNHRVIFHPDDSSAGGYYAIHECHYTKRGARIPAGWTCAEIAPIGDNVEELKWTLEMMRKACDRPLLTERDGELVEYSPQTVSGEPSDAVSDDPANSA